MKRIRKIKMCSKMQRIRSSHLATTPWMCFIRVLSSILKPRSPRWDSLSNLGICRSKARCKRVRMRAWRRERWLTEIGSWLEKNSTFCIKWKYENNSKNLASSKHMILCSISHVLHCLSCRLIIDLENGLYGSLLGSKMNSIA